MKLKWWRTTETKDVWRSWDFLIVRNGIGGWALWTARSGANAVTFLGAFRFLREAKAAAEKSQSLKRIQYA